MARNVRATSLYVIASIVFVLSLYHHLFYHDPISGDVLLRRLPPLSLYTHNLPNHALHDDTFQPPHQTAADLPLPSSHHHLLPPPPGNISTVSFLFPAWEVLVVVSHDTPVNVTGGEQYYCHFDTMETSTATPAGILQNPTRDTFICSLPARVRRRLPFHQPILSTSSEKIRHAKYYNWPELLRWNHVVYDSFTTDDDVVLFAKGMNTRQGVNRNATEFRCVFGNGDNVIKTAVTSSLQEVFRCERPNLTSVISTPSPTLGGFEKEEPIKVALEVIENNHVVHSLAYYTPSRTLAEGVLKSQLCACTMVYNVAKVLKEWVMYHSKIGVEKFILYDNGSDDDLGKVVKELVRDGYDVKTIFWLWPKTQEAGFSHCALHAKDSCNWMTYVDVDEFVYSPSWSILSKPSNVLQRFLPQQPIDNNRDEAQIGQIMIACYEFGPSHQKSHPVKGVMQGYNCRRRLENRHKSIVRLDAIHDSLLNVIHHFHLKEGFKVKRMNVLEAMVNHYKFQAWPEFKAKFRRRVSAYVVDWTVTENAKSNDRTPGLGFTAVEPEGWSDKFCEVYDNALKNLTRRWFGIEDSPSDFHMVWQR